MLAYSRTARASARASLFRVRNDGERELLHMLQTTTTGAHVNIGEDSWYCEIYILPVAKSTAYGVYIIDWGTKDHSVGDIVCFFFPTET